MSRWLKMAAMGCLVALAGCETMTMSKMGMGSGTAPSAVPASDLPKPIKKTALNSPLTPPPAVQPPAADSPAVGAVLASGALAKEYNGVAVAYLSEEGRRWMTEAQRKAALDQAVTALKDKANVTADEQFETSLGAAVGLSMQLVGGDVTGKAGGTVADGYFAEMNDWIDAAFDLLKAGYTNDAAEFFQYGMKFFPHPAQKGRCVQGYAMARPQEAFDFLTAKLKGPSTEEISSAIRMLGHLAASEGLAPAHKDRVMELIAGYATGMMNASYYLDAIYALDVSNDPRAIPPLKAFMKGMMVNDDQQRPALTSLALRYKEPEAIVTLKSIIDANPFSAYDGYDKFFAMQVLVRAGDDVGYAYAEACLKKRGKGFLDSKNEPDLKPDIVPFLIRYGDTRGARAMANALSVYDNDEWLKTWMATGMLLLGDASAMDLAKANIDKPGWEFTAISIAQGLALYGDLSGLATLQRLVSLRAVPPSPAAGMLAALAGKADDTQAQKQRLEQLRMNIAYALGQIDTPPCAGLLATLLADPAAAVRRSAADALIQMSVPEALPIMTEALNVKYGAITKRKIDTTPTICARLVRAAGNRWGGDERVRPLLDQAAASPYASVRFLATAMQR